MTVTKQALRMRRCPICKGRFQPRTKWQKYDTVRCRDASFEFRIKQKLRRLEKLERQLAAQQ